MIILSNLDCKHSEPNIHEDQEHTHSAHAAASS